MDIPSSGLPNTSMPPPVGTKFCRPTAHPRWQGDACRRRWPQSFIYCANSGETRVYDSRRPHQVTQHPALGALKAPASPAPSTSGRSTSRPESAWERATARSSTSKPRSRTASCTRGGSKKTELSNPSSAASQRQLSSVDSTKHLGFLTPVRPQHPHSTRLQAASAMPQARTG